VTSLQTDKHMFDAFDVLLEEEGEREREISRPAPIGPLASVPLYRLHTPQGDFYLYPATASTAPLSLSADQVPVPVPLSHPVPVLPGLFVLPH
jgi:hypothetical protein